MSKTKDLILAMLFGAMLFGLGMWVSQSDTVVEAQGSGMPVLKRYDPDRYQFGFGTYGQQSIYAFRFDRQTGDTQVLTHTGNKNKDKWVSYPFEDKR